MTVNYAIKNYKRRKQMKICPSIQRRLLDRLRLCERHWESCYQRVHAEVLKYTVPRYLYPAKRDEYGKALKRTDSVRNKDWKMSKPHEFWLGQMNKWGAKAIKIRKLLDIHVVDPCIHETDLCKRTCSISDLSNCKKLKINVRDFYSTVKGYELKIKGEKTIAKTIDNF